MPPISRRDEPVEFDSVRSDFTSVHKDHHTDQVGLGVCQLSNFQVRIKIMVVIWLNRNTSEEDIEDHLIGIVIYPGKIKTKSLVGDQGCEEVEA